MEAWRLRGFPSQIRRLSKFDATRSRTSLKLMRQMGWPASSAAFCMKARMRPDEA